MSMVRTKIGAHVKLLVRENDHGCRGLLRSLAMQLGAAPTIGD